jgi:transketolase
MWEALLFAAHHRLSNLTVLVDANSYQAMGKTEDVLNLEPFADKFKSFGFETFSCDGHSLGDLREALNASGLEKAKPQAILAKTVKGKGVSFMEGNNAWHYSRLTDELYSSALRELGD